MLNQTLPADLPATHPAHWLHMPDLHDPDRRGDRPGHVPLHEASECADAD